MDSTKRLRVLWLPGGFCLWRAPAVEQREIGGLIGVRNFWLPSLHGHFRLAACLHNGYSCYQATPPIQLSSIQVLRSLWVVIEPHRFTSPISSGFSIPCPHFYKWFLSKLFLYGPIWVFHLFLAWTLTDTHNHNNINNECWLNRKLIIYWEVRRGNMCIFEEGTWKGAKSSFFIRICILSIS